MNAVSPRGPNAPRFKSGAGFNKDFIKYDPIRQTGDRNGADHLIFLEDLFIIFLKYNN